MIQEKDDESNFENYGFRECSHGENRSINK